VVPKENPNGHGVFFPSFLLLHKPVSRDAHSTKQAGTKSQ
jgi:hypothetical protein